jgi:hypothetical protein
VRIIVSFLTAGMLTIISAALAERVEPPAACEQAKVYGSADCCGRCGCNCPCEKYCRVVCEMKDVKKHVWVVKCEEFCPPLPNRRGACCEGGDCGQCNACKAGADCSEGCQCGRDVCAAERDKNYYPPKCGKMRERKTLEKKEVICKVPSYKCVVVYCCENCLAKEKAKDLQPAPPTRLPPAPAPANKTTLRAPLPPRLESAELN